jgi:hypothetical protein
MHVITLLTFLLLILAAEAQVTFDDDVFPRIFGPRCTSCHGQFSAEAGLRFHTYAAATSNGAHLRAKDSIDSNRMPEGSTLSAELKALYTQWLVDGALENVLQNDPPVAVAGDDFSIGEESVGALDGRASSDDAGIVSFVWSQIAGPDAALNDLGNGEAGFSAPVVDGAGATLTFRLTVTDSAGLDDSDDIVVTISNVNLPPEALAMGDSAALGGQSFTVDGSNSSDVDSSIVSYTWSRISGPTVSIANSASGVIAITAPEVDQRSDLLLQLRVVDDEGESASDRLAVTIFPNEPLAAYAGRDREVGADQLIALRSRDPGVPLATIEWSQLQGETVDLLDANFANAQLIAPAAGATLEFQLEVEDIFGRTAQDAVLLQTLPSLSIPLRRGWNLLSFPFDLSADVWLPGAAYFWTGSQLEPLQPGELPARRGIWLHAPGRMSLDAFGEIPVQTPLVSRPDTWELIGPLTPTVAPAEFAVGWSFGPRGYRILRPERVLKPGEACWLYFITPEILNLGETL